MLLKFTLSLKKYLGTGGLVFTHLLIALLFICNRFNNVLGTRQSLFGGKIQVNMCPKLFMYNDKEYLRYSQKAESANHLSRTTL